MLQPPSHHGAQLDVVYGLEFFHSINRCFLMALCPLTSAGFSFPVPGPWLERCPPISRQRRLQAGPGRVSSHFSSQSGVKEPPFRNVMRRWCGSLNAFSGRGETQQPVVLQSKGTEHTVSCQVLLTGGRKVSPLPAIHWINWPSCLKLAVMELGLLCCACNTSVFPLRVKTNLVKPLQNPPIWSCLWVRAWFLGSCDVYTYNVSPPGSVK